MVNEGPVLEARDRLVAAGAGMVTIRGRACRDGADGAPGSHVFGDPDPAAAVSWIHGLSAVAAGER